MSNAIYTPDPRPALAWSAGGEVACANHQPVGSTWGLNGWEAVSDVDRAIAVEVYGRALVCEHCEVAS